MTHCFSHQHRRRAWFIYQSLQADMLQQQLGRGASQLKSRGYHRTLNPHIVNIDVFDAWTHGQAHDIVQSRQRRKKHRGLTADIVVLAT